MSDTKDKLLIKKLANIVANQQKIINKIAQIHAPQVTRKDDSAAILRALPPHVSSTIAALEVHGNEVKVKFHPGKDSDAVFNAIQQVVQNLQASNVLPGTNYIVKQV
jgi:hypothetical protein